METGIGNAVQCLTTGHKTPSKDKKVLDDLLKPLFQTIIAHLFKIGQRRYFAPFAFLYLALA